LIPIACRFELDAIMPVLQEGVQVLVKDDFTRCFAVQKANHWNWNAYLFPMWLIGVLIRYCILLPIRYGAARDNDDISSNTAQHNSDYTRRWLVGWLVG
jgi:hypothetical protein